MRTLTPIVLLAAAITIQAADLILRYQQPATDWQSQALPIGNGRLGAMIFGDPRHEHFQLNEDSLWTGDEEDTGRYQNLGDLFVDFDHDAATGYQRQLDLSTAIHTVTYTSADTFYRRDAFADAPDRVLVFHFGASNTGKYTGTIRL